MWRASISVASILNARRDEDGYLWLSNGPPIARKEMEAKVAMGVTTEGPLTDVFLWHVSYSTQEQNH